MIIVDSHCHLDDERLSSQGIGVLLERAKEKGIEYAQTICTTKADFEKIHPMACEHKNLFCSYGIHPHSAEDDIVTLEELLENGSKEKVIGIGETGLDYYYDNAPRERQRESFKLHLEAARKLDLPVIIHTRDADEDTIEILDEAIKAGSSKLLLHCFSSPGLTEFAVEKGLYVSASGIITFKNAEAVRESFKQIPMDKILVETDAPYLAPIPHRGKTNEPSYTFYVAEKMAEIKGISMEEVCNQTTENFFNLFSRAVR